MVENSTSGGEWYCRIANRTIGPLSTDELIAFAKNGGLSPDHMVRNGKSGDWIEAATVGPLFELIKKRNRWKVGNGDDDERSSILPDLLDALRSMPSAAKEKLSDGWDYLLYKIGSLHCVLASKITLVIVGLALCVLGLRLVPLHRVSAGDPQTTYVLIWSELKDLRERKASDAEWKEFSERSQKELQQIVARLEKANANDVASLQILRAGRDYLPQMLHDARHEPSPSEKRLAETLDIARFAQLDRESRVSRGTVLTTAVLCFDACLVLCVLYFAAKRFVRL